MSQREDSKPVYMRMADENVNLLYPSVQLYVQSYNYHALVMMYASGL